VPKLIDHTAREIEVAEAAWRVAARDGIRGVSVRTVATEAGIAPASLRRAFPTQAALLAYCLDLIRRRAAARITALAEITDTASAAAVLEELLPLDDERRLEAEVQFSLGTAALADPSLRTVADAAHRDVAHACRLVARVLTAPPRTERTTAMLHALLDGLALHLIRQGEDEPTDWAVEVLRRQLADLHPADAGPGNTGA
jgi:AcrR family transcriptional regulator